jgi:ADP-heptose:LPS heptosyltransferase
MTTPNDSRKRILVVALDNLGDLVFASALVPPLHAAFPSATIDVWCKRYTADVAALIPHVSNVIAADPYWARPRQPPHVAIADFVRGISTVRSFRYDIAILSEAPWRVAAAVAATRIPRRIGLARRRNSLFLTDVLPAQDVNKPVLREQARLLGALDIESTHPRYRLDADRLGDIRGEVARQLPTRFAALHPFAATRSRCVPLSEWVGVAATLMDQGTPPLWVGTSSELDELRSQLASDAHHMFADRLTGGSLRATAAALSLATLFVGHDSGPLHIAGAFGVPVVGIFAPGQPLRTFPQGVGPSRMLHRPSPDGITAAMILREIDALHLTSAS